MSRTHRRTALTAAAALAAALLIAGPIVVATPAQAITPGWQERTYGAHGLKVVQGGSDHYDGGGTVDSAGRVLLLSPAQPAVASIQITRLGLDGAEDPAFGTAGSTTLPTGPTYTSVLSAGDAVFVAAPPTTGNAISLAKLSAGGVIDAGFGTGGLASVPLPTATSTISGLARLTNGDVLISAQPLALPGTSYVAAVNPATGALDTSWNAGGTTPGVVSSGNQIRDVAADGNSALLLVVGSSGAAVVQRRGADGTVDPTFAVSGARPLSTSFGAEQVSVASDGNYYVSGSYGVNRTGQMAVTRILPSGTVDTGFGSAGIARITISDCGPTARSVALSGSRLYVFGQHTPASGCFAERLPIVARLTAAGVLDPTFGSGGFIQLGSESLGTGNSRAQGLYDGGVQPSGAPVLALQLIASDVTRMGAIKLNPDSVAPNGSYVPLLPRRILDTRSGTGAPAHAVAAGGTLTVTVAGHGGVPTSGVGAVLLNVTAVGSTRGGYVSLYQTGQSWPGTSTLTYPAGATTPNAVVIPLGAGGSVNLKNGSTGTVHLLADVLGYYRDGTATVPGAFTPLAPRRIVDTRTGTGTPSVRLAPGGTLTFGVAGWGGVAVSGVSAVVANITAAAPAASGYLTVYPGGTSRPGVSTLNYSPGQTRSNLATVRLGAAGDWSVYNGSSGTVDLVVDVAGYYLDGTPTEPGTFVAVDPQRLLDTRTAGPPNTGPMKPDSVRSAGAPVEASAIVVNGTVTQPSRGGFMAFQGTTEYYNGHYPVSALNFVAHQTAANMAIVAPNGFWIFNRSTGTSQVIVDLEGYFLP
jgi:uncharacterized delta-60 repeat protein